MSEKMQLSKFFATDKKTEVGGVRIEILPGTAFVIARASSQNQKYQKALRDAYRPYEILLRGGELPPEKDAELNTQVIVESLLLGWEGVQYPDGVDLDFTRENAVTLLMALPDLREWVWKQANDPANYRIKEELGKG